MAGGLALHFMSLIDNSRLYKLLLSAGTLPISEVNRRAKITIRIRFRCYFIEVGLLSDKVFVLCICPVIREASVVLDLLTI